MASTGGDRYCRWCDYPLVEAGVGGVCPECGRGFDPADASTWSARPTAARRRWVRRGVMLLMVIVLAEVFAPSRVARFTWTWPNADGVTVTSETRWHLVGPRWMPIPYPRFTVARWTSPMPGGYLPVADYTIWRVGVASVKPEIGIRSSVPPDPRPNMRVVGCLYVVPVEWIVDIVPGNFDTLAELLLEEHGPRELSWSPRVLRVYPAEIQRGSR